MISPDRLGGQLLLDGDVSVEPLGQDVQAATLQHPQDALIHHWQQWGVLPQNHVGGVRDHLANLLRCEVWPGFHLEVDCEGGNFDECEDFVTVTQLVKHLIKIVRDQGAWRP